MPREDHNGGCRDAREPEILRCLAGRHFSMNSEAAESIAPTPVVAESGTVRGNASTNYPLQYLRAIAALSVVVCHASYYAGQARGDQMLWGIFGRGGGFGVTLFFAISGYLMAQLAVSTPPYRFLAHRLVRIYPIYWLCLLTYVMISRAFGTPVNPDPLALLLVPGATRDYVLGVEWTLPFELTFYLIVFGVIATGLRRRLPLIAAVWLALIPILIVLKPDLQQGQFPLLLNLPFALPTAAFAGGLLVPFAIQKRWIGPGTPLLAIALLVASEALVGIHVALGAGAMSCGCILLVASAAQAGITGSRFPNRALVALGDWSYALYLCHVPVIMALCIAMPKSVPLMQLWFAAIGIPIAVSIVFGKIDLKMYRILKSVVDRSARPVRVTVCAIFLGSMLVVGIFTYVRDIQSRHATSRSAPLASKILSTINSDQSNADAAALTAGLQKDDTLRGYFNGLYWSAGSVQIAGWTGDTTISRRQVKVLFFDCNKYLGVAEPVEHRPDVAAVLHTDSDRYGFNATFTVPQACASPHVWGVVVAADGTYTPVVDLSHH